jgi:hypothetical protein
MTFSCRQRSVAGQVAIAWRSLRTPAQHRRKQRSTGESTLRVLGVFSSATLVATFEQPLAPEGPQVMIAGAPMPIAAPLEPVPPERCPFASSASRRRGR